MISSISHAGGQHAASNSHCREIFLTRHHFLLIRPSADRLGASHHYIGWIYPNREEPHKANDQDADGKQNHFQRSDLIPCCNRNHSVGQFVLHPLNVSDR